MDFKITFQRLAPAFRVTLATCLIFAISTFGNFIYGDNLSSVSGTGTHVIKNSNFTNVATTASIDVTNINKVLVFATFELERTQAATSRTVKFRLSDNRTTPNTSPAISRTLEGGGTVDYGIGSLVYEFDVSGITGNLTYSLQHENLAAQDVTTRGSIVAISLTTATSQKTLNSKLKSLASGSNTTSSTFVGIPGLTTDGLLLPVTGGMVVSASINCQKIVANTSSDAGQWTLQMKKGLNGSWNNVGKAVQRSMSTTSDAGIVTLYYLINDQPRDYYYFRVAQRVSVGSGVEIQTMTNSTIAAAALSYENSGVGRRFQIQSVSPVNASTTSTSASNCASITTTPAGTETVLIAQFGMSALAGCLPVYNLSSPGTLTSLSERRTLSSGSDKGAGGIVGKVTGLSGSSTFNLQHRLTAAGTTLTTNDIILGLINLTDNPSPGYWEGDVSADWHTTGNWSDGTIPTSTTNVTILNYTNAPVIAAAATCKNLIVAPNAGIKANTGIAFSIVDSVFIESNATGSGSFICAGTPKARVQRYVAPSANHLVAPMTGVSTANDYYISLTHDSWLSYHTESTNAWAYITDISTSLTRGKGYSYWVDATAYTVEFRGTLTAATQNPVLSYSGSGATQGWNLLGNPYASSLDWDLGTWGTNTTGTVYVWDYTKGTTGDYKTWNGTTGDLTGGIIPMGQGFFVQSTSAGSFAVPVGARVHSTQAFYKSSNDSEPTQYVCFQLDGEGYRNTVFVGFPENGTGEFDYKGDATKLYSSFETPQLFAIENEKELCINANAPLTEAGKTVPLNLVQIVDGNYTLTTSDFDQLPDAKITLEDLKTGASQDLNESPVYSFTASKSDDAKRFLLHFAYSPDGIGEDFEKTSNVHVYSYGNDIYVRSTDDAIHQQGEVFVYDLMGREIAQHKITKGELIKLTVNLNNAYAVVKVVKDGSYNIKKVFIQ